MNLIRIPLDDDNAIYVNPVYIVAVVPTETKTHCYLVLINDDEGSLVAMSAEECVEHIRLCISVGDAYR